LSTRRREGEEREEGNASSVLFLLLSLFLLLLLLLFLPSLPPRCGSRFLFLYPLSIYSMTNESIELFLCFPYPSFFRPPFLFFLSAWREERERAKLCLLRESINKDVRPLKY